MSQAHASFSADLDAKKFKSGLSDMEQSTKRATSRIGADFQKANTSMFGGHRAGQLSMQIQDIAVQLQGGAKAATVLAQQGSQIASAFGPTGAIIGGVLAIGAGIFSWATGAAKANKELEETMRLVSEGQKRSSGLLSGARSDQKAADRANIGGPRADIGLLQADFNEDMKAMQKGFDSTPAHRRDRGAEGKAIAARTARFDAERAKLYDAHEERAESKQAAERERAQQQETSVLRAMEKDQIDSFIAHRKAADEHEKAAREGLADSIERAAKVQEENTERNKRVSALQSQLEKEQARGAIDAQAEVGQRINERAGEILKSPSQRAQERRAERQMEQAQRRAISEEIDAEDRRNRQKGGSGLPKDRRDDMRRGREAGVNAEKNKGELKAVLDRDAVQDLKAAIKELITT